MTMDSRPQSAPHPRAHTVAAGKTRRSYRAGRATREAIVKAAETVLMEHGQAQFSVQRVAKAMGISPGNLNYYFPTRASLLGALILHTLEQYRLRTQAIEAMPTGKSRPAGVDAVLRWLMNDAKSASTSRLFRQLWAIAATDAATATSMDQFYTRSVRGHLRRLGLRPGAGDLDPEALLFLINVISEGTTVLFGTRQRSTALYRKVEDLAARAINLLIAVPGNLPAPARPRRKRQPEKRLLGAISD